jgi:hypothetical protein
VVVPGEQQAGRFSVIPARALFDRSLGDAGLRVLAILGCHSDRDGWCYPSLAKLASDTGVSRQAVSKQVGVLQELGYLLVVPRCRENGSRTSNKYRMIMDPPQPVVAAPATSGGCAPPQPLEVAPITSQIELPTKEDVWSPDGDAPPPLAGDTPPGSDDEPPPPLPRPAKDCRAAVWDAYVEGTGITPLTRAEKSSLGAIVRDTLEAGFTPKQVRAACDEYRHQWGQRVTITHRAVYHNLTVLLKNRHERKERERHRDSQPIV